jgi:hydrogenase maturation factor HypF (carbamoyltransferase family)
MQIDKEDYEFLKSALQRFQEMMSDDENDEQDNSKEINVCKKYISLINKPVTTTNEQPIIKCNHCGTRYVQVAACYCHGTPSKNGW